MKAGTISSKSGVKKIPAALLQILLILYAAVQVYPLIWLFLFSFKDNNQIYSGYAMGLPRVWRFSNYTTVLTSGNVSVYLLNSLIVTAVTIAVSSVLITTSAYAVARMRWKLSGVFLTYVLLGLMVPIHATLLPLFIILRNLNLLNTRLSLIVPYVVFALPMGIFIMTGFLKGIPRELEESACLDGCGVYRMFYHIILPLLRPAIATVAIFTFLSSWNELMFANTFLNDDALKTLTVGVLSLAGQQGTQWGPIGAGLMIATLPTLVIYFLLSDQLQKSMIAGAVKG